MDDFTVLFFNKMNALTVRIRNVLEGCKICVVDYKDKTRLFNALSVKEHRYSLILLDVDLKEEQFYASGLIAEVRRRTNNEPIIVMTAPAEKKCFVDAILHGATDFIAKPFDNQVLVAKIYKYLYPENSDKTEFVTLDLYQYLKGELRKAEKGRFPLTLMFLNIKCQNSEEADLRVIPYVFENMRDIFWDTDVFIRFLSKYYLGVFPFCDEKNKLIVENKVTARFEELVESNPDLKDYSLETVYVSYPHDTDKAADIYDLLIKRVNEKYQL